MASASSASRCILWVETQRPADLVANGPIIKQSLPERRANKSWKERRRASIARPLGPGDRGGGQPGGAGWGELNQSGQNC